MSSDAALSRPRRCGRGRGGTRWRSEQRGTVTRRARHRALSGEYISGSRPRMPCRSSRPSAQTMLPSARHLGLLEHHEFQRCRRGVLRRALCRFGPRLTSRSAMRLLASLAAFAGVPTAGASAAPVQTFAPRPSPAAALGEPVKVWIRDVVLYPFRDVPTHVAQLSESAAPTWCGRPIVLDDIGRRILDVPRTPTPPTSPPKKKAA